MRFHVITNTTEFVWISGPSVLAGLAMMIILIPVNAFIASNAKTLQIKQMKNKDERVKLMNEILSGMKVTTKYKWPGICKSCSRGGQKF